MRPNASAETYIWRGTDDPGRLDTAVAHFEGERLRAHGTSLTSRHSSSWALTTGTDLATGTEWATRTLAVAVNGDGWFRSLELRRGVDGWSATATAGGNAGLPAPGLAEPEALADALDCDLGLCPLTNTMPIRRFGLHTGAGSTPALTMAWVEVPSLRVLPSRQMYRGLGNGKVEFRSADSRSGDGGFSAELTVDHDGIVVDYPGLAALVR
ncbi:putative glycolipid-binding domain-containing protein [Arthrobacter ginkgonis]|uniref:Glycolipid-binding domain-containing protein n=1 Tax=Arthrobacter ginkgonis TaxID=1630594 RepID=A0ABP7CP21_9MICC